MKKVYVYAICKNEEKHINRWYNSMKEADAIFVLDTGSSDNSVKMLEDLGVNVKVKTYEKFKFDEARNDSLALVPMEDAICGCTDIDEVLDKGWREKVDSIWKSNTNRICYNMNFSFDDDGNPISTYYISKIHDRFNYKWTHEIHEVIEYIGTQNENVIYTDLFCISHLPDKSKSREFYLDLLEYAVNNNPNDARDIHYLGREYMYKGMWSNAIDTLIKHVNIENAWDIEKGASMRFISRCYRELNRNDEALMWLRKASEITPDTKEVYVELGLLYYSLGNNKEAILSLTKANTILEKSNVYVNEEFAWNETTYDILSICYYNLGMYDEAIFCANKALKINPHNDRIKSNLEIYKQNQKSL